ncbi:IclR family transcriptional regulator [Novosphingobium sp. 9U]|uniref:IclR family transcriptional regulator n=1 Tax=Novosphingobium sp. 9U TaxID=2653158 RepID=UPI0012F04185|nr:helix-turn-helix domain-containing protein [Novosphingobium sp. 9U]VWX50594.1 conserved hypothetical protein [Novosphingobium sp. 9U]
MKTLPNVGGEQYAPWDIEDIDKSTRSIKSAERTLALFELFSLHQKALTIGEICRALDIPQPSVTMLVRNLVKMGYLEHDRGARTYIPTIRIMLLGSWLHRLAGRKGDMEAHLDALMNATEETTIIGIQNGIYSQYVSAQLPNQPTRLEIQSGMLRPMPRTAVGRALLSRKTDAEIALILRRYNAEVDASLRYTLPEFMDLMNQIREDGFAQTMGDMTGGFSAIAIAIPAPIGKIPIAVGVGGPIDRITVKKTLILEALAAFSRDYNSSL